MSLTVGCDACGRKYNVADQWAGKRVKCKNCGAAMTVPAAEPAGGAFDPPDIDSLLSGATASHDDAPPPPIQATARGRTGTAVRATPTPAAVVAPPPPPQPVGYQAPIARTRTANVHGQPAVGLDGVTPLLLLLYVLAEVVAAIVETTRLKNLPPEVQEIVTAGTVWTYHIASIVLLFAIAGPAVWLGMFITGKILNFSLGDSGYLRACGVAAVPGLIVSFLPVLRQLNNPVLLIGAVVAILPVAYFLLKAIFNLSWVGSAVGYVFAGMFYVVGGIAKALILAAIVGGAIFGAAAAKKGGQQQASLNLPGIGTTGNRSSSYTIPAPTPNTGSTATPAPPPPPPVIDTIPDNELPTLPAAAELDPAKLQHDTFVANFMFKPLRDLSFTERRGGERPLVTFAGPGRSVGTRSGQSVQVPSHKLETSAVLARETAYKTADTLKAQSPRAKTGTVAGLPYVATFDVDQTYNERQYVTTYHVFAGEHVLAFKAVAFEPFTQPIHRELASSLHTLKKLDPLAQALGDVKADDPKLKQVGLERLAALDLTDRRADVVAAIDPMLRSPEPRVRLAALTAIGKWGEGQAVTTAVLDGLKDQSPDVRKAAMSAAAKAKLEPAVDPIAERLGQDAEAVDALIAYGSRGESAAATAAQRKDATRPAKAAAMQVLQRVATKESIPALMTLAADADKEISADARGLINRLQPGSIDALTQVLLDLKGGDHWAKEAAMKKLADLPVDDARRPEVAGVLLEQVVGDAFMKEQTQDLLVKWASDQTVERLVGYVDEQRTRRQAVAMLAKLKDPRGVGPIVKLLADDRHTASEALKKFGPVAEDEVIKALNTNKESFARAEICEILAEIGTEKSWKALNILAKSNDFHASNAAKRALDKLKPRLQEERRR